MTTSLLVNFQSPGFILTLVLCIAIFLSRRYLYGIRNQSTIRVLRTNRDAYGEKLYCLLGKSMFVFENV